MRMNENEIESITTTHSPSANERSWQGKVSYRTRKCETPIKLNTVIIYQADDV